MDGVPTNLVMLRDGVENDGGNEAMVSPSMPSLNIDIKICVLDFETIYNNKDKSAIPTHLLEMIDGNTVIVLSNTDRISIRIPEPPSKMRFKNSPLAPSDSPRRAFRGLFMKNLVTLWNEQVELRCVRMATQRETTLNTVISGCERLPMFAFMKIACKNADPRFIAT